MDEDPSPVTIVSRKEWGALPPKAKKRAINPLPKVILTYDAKIEPCYSKEECIVAMQTLQRRHMEEEGCDDIKWNFLISADGLVYEGRGWTVQSCPSLKYSGYRNKRIDFAFLGNWESHEFVPVWTFILQLDLQRHGVIGGYISDERKNYDIVGPPTWGYQWHRPLI